MRGVIWERISSRSWGDRSCCQRSMEEVKIGVAASGF